jgi:hypothetical protein
MLMTLMSSYMYGCMHCGMKQAMLVHHPRVVEWLAAVESAARRHHVFVGALLWKDNSVHFCILLVTKHLSQKLAQCTVGITHCCSHLYEHGCMTVISSARFACSNLAHFFPPPSIMSVSHQDLITAAVCAAPFLLMLYVMYRQHITFLHDHDGTGIAICA